jgi:hypothetical protein
MKILVRLTLSTLFGLLVIPRQSSAQPAAPPPAPPAAPADQPPPPDPTQPAPPDNAAQPLPPVPPPAAPPTPPKPDATTARGVEWSSLRLLREKGVISEAEYASALKDLGGVGGGADATTLVVSKLKVTLFGFAEANVQYNSTEYCFEFCSNFLIPRSGTYKGDHSRLVFGPRDTRFGVRFQAPEEHGIRASGLIETDFFGSQAGTSEAALWTNPVLRIRHSYLKLETPIVDVLIGQTGNLFGWASAYLVTGAQPPGLPGQMYQRTPQLRVSKTIKTDAVTAEFAIAGERPVQMDSGIPEGVAGVRLQFNKWTGYHTYYLSTSVVQPASIAVTGDLRGFRIAEYAATPKISHFRAGGGFAVDAYLPIVPATKASRDNSLSVSGEFVVGLGTQDMYTALGGAGTVIPALPPAMAGGAPVPYVPNFDPGFAAYEANGHLELLKWTSYMVGAEYYPPGVGGRLGLDINYGHMESSNTKKFAGPNTRDHESFFGSGAFFDPTKQTRVGADFGYYRDHYVGGGSPKNYSLMTSAWLFF